MVEQRHPDDTETGWLVKNSEWIFFWIFINSYVFIHLLSPSVLPFFFKGQDPCCSVVSTETGMKAETTHYVCLSPRLPWIRSCDWRLTDTESHGHIQSWWGMDEWVRERMNEWMKAGVNAQMENVTLWISVCGGGGGVKRRRPQAAANIIMQNCPFCFHCGGGRGTLAGVERGWGRPQSIRLWLTLRKDNNITPLCCHCWLKQTVSLWGLVRATRSRRRPQSQWRQSLHMSTRLRKSHCVIQHLLIFP